MKRLTVLYTFCVNEFFLIKFIPFLIYRHQHNKTFSLTATYKWIQVDFRQPRQVFGVVTQGRATGSNHYVTAFKVQYGNSPNMQQMRYISDRTGQPMVGFVK